MKITHGSQRNCWRTQRQCGRSLRLLDRRRRNVAHRLSSLGDMFDCDFGLMMTFGFMLVLVLRCFVIFVAKPVGRFAAGT